MNYLHLFYVPLSLRFRGLSNYVFNHNFGEILAMAVFTTIAFATLFLENDHFITFYEGTFYLANYFCSFNNGSTYFYFTVNIGKKNTVENDFLLFFNVVAEEVNIQELTFFSFELLSLNFYDYVHLLDVIFRLYRRVKH